MKTLTRHRHVLSWIGGLAVAATIAAGGATTVLAEGPACTVDGRPISQEEAAADPSLCADPAPAPTQPAPDPAPQTPDPAPAPEPEPTPEPAPPAQDTTAPPASSEEPAAPAQDTAPDTAAPAGDTATPAAPIAETPAATTTPAAGTPAATTDEQASPAAPTATTTGDTGAKPATKPAKPKRPASATPATHAPTPAEPKITPAPTTPAQVIKAKRYDVPFADARLFREQYEPDGRIPEQPQLEQAQIDAFADAAAGTGTPWTTLAAIAWTQSEWKTIDAAQLRSAATFLGTSNANNPEGALRAFLSRSGSGDAARETQIMADYFAAMGEAALLDGLDDPEVRGTLATETLDDERITIYDGGRSDIEAGLIDPRILVTIRFLAARFHEVSISSMVTGHGVYTAGGNVSLHAFGQAVDIATLDGEVISAGTQGKDGNTYHAVRDLLLLPEAMQPKELISLWEMGGASFAAADHDDHIHVGFDTEHGAEADHDH